MPPLAKHLSGETLGLERGNVLSEKCHSGKCWSEKCEPGICCRESFSLGFICLEICPLICKLGIWKLLITLKITQKRKIYKNMLKEMCRKS